jgi:hypothetical protein
MTSSCQSHATLPKARCVDLHYYDVMAATLLNFSKAVMPEYQRSSSAGLRLAAICVLHQFPNPAELHWLAERCRSLATRRPSRLPKPFAAFPITALN